MIFLWPHSALLMIENKVTEMHSHYALELYVGLDSTFEMDFGSGSKSYRFLAVNSRTKHRFSGNKGFYALILINPGNSNFSRTLTKILNGKRYLDLTHLSNTDIFHTFSNPLNCDKALKWVCSIFNILDNCCSKTEKKSGIKDSRILESCIYINNSYQDKISLLQLAEGAKLSESRFRHLFKQETGISIRYYILNKRTVEAVKLIIQGYSKTDAAHHAGFSDSSHLSRTFKKMYGLTLSTLYKTKDIEPFHLCI